VTRFEARPTQTVNIVLAATTVLVVLVDLNTQLGVADWVFYVAPVAVSFFAWRPLLPLAVAAAATLLTIVGYFGSPRGMDPSLALLNRSFGVGTIWILGVLGWVFIRGKLVVARQEWLTAGENQLTIAIRGDLTDAKIGYRVLRALASILDAQIAAFYVERDGAFERVATWAGGEDPGKASFRPGEGLVGQAAEERRILRLDDVPERDLAVTSGLAAVKARHLLVVPVHAGDTVNAVVELGFVHPIHDSDLEMLKVACEPIGVAVESARYRARLRDLVEETRRQSAELEAQGEELRVNNDELQEQAEALREAQARLETQHSELEETNAQLEIQTRALDLRRADLERTQQRLEEKAAELERANRYKSEFLANMSHELRTPLNSSLILSKLLAENRDGNLSAEQVKFARTIHDSGNDLLALISDVLDLAKIEAGRLEIHPEPFPVARLLDQLGTMFQPTASQNGLAFERHVEPGVPQTLETDLQRLLQILQNLLSNAFKFTRRGGVVLTVSPESGGRVVFAVKDTGIGISSDQHELIFEAFRQADGTTSRRFGGTGLGLSISRDLAHLLRGELHLESTVGVGSTFSLVIPTCWAEGAARGGSPAAPSTSSPAFQHVAHADGAHAPPSREAEPPSGATRGGAAIATDPPPAAPAARSAPDGARVVLVVEDDAAFAGIVADLARERGFEPAIAGTVAAARRSVAERVPSAVVLDVTLPDGNGLTFLDALKRDPATRHVPVHVIAGSDHAGTAMDLGAVGYALKPIAREKLADAFALMERRLARTARRVLVVEDDPVEQASICRLLGGGEVECTSVNTVAAALDALGSASFDCMVMDLALPDGSGFDLLDRMAAGHRAPFPPVIVYTGRSLTREEEQRLRRYSRSIIVKGARSPERLLDEVNLFLHRIEADLPPDRQRMLRDARSREAVFENRRILVVEDDVRNVYALASILEPRGATVEIARNGREAVERLERAPAMDLVLMDIMMPEMDGYEAMRLIRGRPELSRLPIVALTARAMRDDRDRCLAAGASDYIAKPLDVDRLLSLIRVWMPR
jgi:CheY-like chemotaxis protein